MTQYKNINVKLSNLQLNKLKSAIKNSTEVTLKLSSNMIGESNDATNFPYELLLTDRQVSKLRNAFGNKSSANVKLSKTYLSKIVQSVGFPGRLRGTLLKIGLALMKNVLTPLAKSVLIQLGLTEAVSAADTGIHKKVLGFGHPLDVAQQIPTLIISNEEMENMKIIKSLKKPGLLIKGVRKTIENKEKEQKVRLISILLSTLGTSSLRNLLTAKRSNKNE